MQMMSPAGEEYVSCLMLITSGQCCTVPTGVQGHRSCCLLGGPHLAVVTDSTAFDCHAQQPSTVAFTDLHFEVLLPAVVAVGVSAFHCCGIGDRNVAEAAPTLKFSRLGNCRLAMGVGRHPAKYA